MKAATAEVKEEDSVANRVADTMMAARLAMLAVVSATWPRTAVKDKSAITVVVWDTSAATATKPLKPRFVIGVNNPATSPATVPTSQLKPTRPSHKARGLIASDLHPPLEHLLKIGQCWIAWKQKNCSLISGYLLVSLWSVCLCGILRSFFYVCMVIGTGNGVC